MNTTAEQKLEPLDPSQVVRLMTGGDKSGQRRLEEFFFEQVRALEDWQLALVRIIAFEPHDVKALQKVALLCTGNAGKMATAIGAAITKLRDDGIIE